MKYKQLPVTDVTQFLQTANPLILDCRDVKDYQAGHLDNALHVHEGLKESLIKRGDKQRSLLIYCYYGHAMNISPSFLQTLALKTFTVWWVVMQAGKTNLNRRLLWKRYPVN